MGEAPIIPNPAYKGPWVQPKIDNEIYKFNHGGVGIEIWQVKAGSIFDNILVTDGVSDASAAAKKIVELRDAEKEQKQKADAASAAEEEEEMARIEAEFEEDDATHGHDEL